MLVVGSKMTECGGIYACLGTSYVIDSPCFFVSVLPCGASAGIDNDDVNDG